MPSSLSRPSKLGRVEGLSEHRDRTRRRRAAAPGNGWPSLPPCANEKRAGSVEARRRAVARPRRPAPATGACAAQLLEQQERGEVAQVALVARAPARRRGGAPGRPRRGPRGRVGISSRRTVASVADGSRGRCRAGHPAPAGARPSTRLLDRPGVRADDRGHAGRR
jgi:hypothetical protein